MKFRFTLLLLIAIILTNPLLGEDNSALDKVVKKQEVSVEQFAPIADSIYKYISPKAIVGGAITVENVFITPSKSLEIHFSRVLGDYPIRDRDVKELYSITKALLPTQYSGYKVKCYSNKSSFEELASPYYSGRELNSNIKNLKKEKAKWVKELNPEYEVSNGLQESHIAIWQSHGFYYDQKLARWEWQRARIFQTVEDLYTQSYVLPFLVPMLEKAGAYVMLPRERDFHSYELIVDNDPSTSSRVGGEYIEEGVWSTSPVEGFADIQQSYEFGENPFTMGSSRVAECVKEKSTATATWRTYVDEDGTYAVYVSYTTLPNSTPNALYTVNFEGGSKQFMVNQTMGGGTWVYLGSFPFKKGGEYSVELSNSTAKSQYTKGSVVTADGVKIGGGMGNMARKPSESISENRQSALPEDNKSLKSTDFSYYSEVSGYPRIKEGSRYWLQWAGYSDTVYSANKNMNDYNDDYMSRGRWVNVLSGGSKVNPNEKGKGVPVDLSMAFHTDAGTTLDDTMVGTLSIYTRFSNNKDTYPTGESRMVSRELADLVQTQIVDDVRALHDEQWPRRGLWDRSYHESRSPEVPSLLLELLSHQNLADMRYGLDPKFRFTVSRAIYKAILRFQSSRYDFDYVVQPLPVESFAAVLVDGKGDKPSVRLSFRGVEDSLEPTAVPEGYVVYYTKEGGESSHVYVPGKSNLSELVYTELPIEANSLYRFKVVAVNKGGASFPSEELSVGTTSDWKSSQTVLVMNGFDRVSAPASFATKDSTIGGFINYLDGGVPYMNDYSFIGPQHEFRRSIPWMDDDAPGFGASYAHYESKVVAGNTFNYPAKHGKSLLKAGYNFVSASRLAVASEDVKLTDYPVVDMIMGKQTEIFTPLLQKQIENYCQNGGRLLISGSYIASDIWDDMFGKKPEKESNLSQTKQIVNSLQMSSESLKELISSITANYAKAQKTNDSLRFDYLDLDTLTINKVLQSISEYSELIDTVCSDFQNIQKDLTAFEQGTDPTERAKRFATDVLKFRWMTHYASATCQVKMSQNPFGIGYNTQYSAPYSFQNTPNEKVYAVESPDGLVPVGENAWTVFRYADNNISAGVAYKGDDYRCVTLGFPIEVLEEESQIDNLLSDILRFLTE